MSVTRSITIDRLLVEYAPPYGDRSAQHPCQGARFHSPTPLTTSMLALPTGRQVSLCPTCSANLGMFIHLAHVAPEKLTWPVLREFGNTIRAMGQDSMDAIHDKHKVSADAP